MIAVRLASVVCAFALMGAFWDSGISRDVSGSAPASAQGLVTLATAIGNITVKAWSGNGVKWIAHESAGNQQDLKRLSVDVTRDGGNVTLKAIPFEGCQGCGINLEVWVPRSAAVTASGATGNIVVDGVANTVIARTSMGNVDLSASDGDVIGQTQTGNVSASLASLRGTRKVTLSSATGNLDLALPRAAGATISASTDIGNITSAFGSPQRQMMSATLRTKLGPGGVDVRLSTRTGNVTLHAL